MFNFRDEFERISEYKLNTEFRYQYEAEEFLKEFLKNLKQCDISTLKKITTFLFYYDYEKGIIKVNKDQKGTLFFEKEYDVKDVTIVFCEIKKIIKSYYPKILCGTNWFYLNF